MQVPFAVQFNMKETTMYTCLMKHMFWNNGKKWIIEKQSYAYMYYVKSTNIDSYYYCSFTFHIFHITFTFLKHNMHFCMTQTLWRYHSYKFLTKFKWEWKQLRYLLKLCVPFPLTYWPSFDPTGPGLELGQDIIRAIPQVLYTGKL